VQNAATPCPKEIGFASSAGMKKRNNLTLTHHIWEQGSRVYLELHTIWVRAANAYSGPRFPIIVRAVLLNAYIAMAALSCF